MFFMRLAKDFLIGIKCMKVIIYIYTHLLGTFFELAYLKIFL